MYRPEHKKGPRRRFVVSCQHFSITIGAASTTGTATINAVDTARSFIVWGGSSSTSSVMQYAIPTLVLTNSTTITATRGLTGGSCVVRGTIVHATGALVRSVQAGTITLAAATSGTATINAVDIAYSVMFYNGIVPGAAGSNLPNNLCALALTNSTTVTASADAASSSTIAYTVVEFQPGVVRRVVDGTVLVTNANTVDVATLAAEVNPAIAATVYGGTRTGIGTVDAALCRAALTAANQVTVTRTTGTGAGHGVASGVVEFAPDVVRSVQRGTVGIAASLSGTAAINPVDLTRSWCAWLGVSTAVAATVTTSFSGVYLSDAQTVTGELGSAGTVTDSFEVVSFF